MSVTVDGQPGAVVTRFAPSPTGYLHIGGARTALYNWLFARKTGGRFLLRVEDTDRARSTQQAVDAILDGLSWLGLMPEGEPVFQFARADRHREAALELVARGGAFRCYLSGEDETALKEAARAEGRAFRSPWRDRTDGDLTEPHTVRLRAPDQDGIVTVADRVQGEVRTRGADLDDMILLRTDGTPTYMLAVVVDDHDMGVTHVIRGDDHLTNAARQTALIQAFGWPVPVYAHIPLIHGEDGRKLSKRHGAQAVHEYREMGYLPEAMRAYLLKLGWSKGDLDILDDAEAARLFDLDGLGRSPSRLDFDKLASVNAHFIRLADNARLAGLVGDELVRRGASRPARDLAAAIAVVKERAKTIPELADQCAFILAARPLTLDEKSSKLLQGEVIERLRRAAAALAAVTDWRHEALKQSINGFAATEGVGLGKVGPPLRAALTGGLVAPDLAQALELLGRDEAMGRLEDVLSTG
jgi:glutamyl-tRNA synthetase